MAVKDLLPRDSKRVLNVHRRHRERRPREGVLDENLVGDTSQAKAVGLVGVPDGELRQALASLVHDVFRMFDCATVLVSHGRDGRQRPAAIRTFGRKAPLLHFLPPLGMPGGSKLQGLRMRLGQHRAHHEDALLTCVVGLCISIGL